MLLNYRPSALGQRRFINLTLTQSRKFSSNCTGDRIPLACCLLPLSSLSLVAIDLESLEWRSIMSVVLASAHQHHQHFSWVLWPLMLPLCRSTGNYLKNL